MNSMVKVKTKTQFLLVVALQGRAPSALVETLGILWFRRRRIKHARPSPILAALPYFRQ